ncbi:M15 family metallopeptidase [Nocardioides sp. AE5]|uniref:M15 family metallopeptidase n=1 Tax=Nocardioides sp. AE5 TaxID=2962573 RepID=UPI0028827D70|nr:M15 family metallopeptidase [Nocardioides sp. AE5]MDT0202990.1 M15 family metallopeptidase [Nocardioides sp. AE5]
MRIQGAVASAAVLVAALAAGCGGSVDEAAPPVTPASTPTTQASAPSSPADPSRVPATSPSPEPGTVPPEWLGTRILPRTESGYGEVRATPPELVNRRFTLPDQVPMLPGDGFASRITSPPPDEVIARSTWQPGCPVGVDDLAWIRLTFHGFDGERHTGELLVNARVADDIVAVFADLWDAEFPIEQMVIARQTELDAPPTGDGNGTGAFNCRPTTGSSSFSQHAYGLAIDVNAFQNPYQKGDVVLPELAASYLDRANVRPGMILAGDPVVRAFARIGWEWGGAWRTLEDYQHFSENGR